MKRIFLLFLSLLDRTKNGHCNRNKKVSQTSREKEQMMTLLKILIIVRYVQVHLKRASASLTPWCAFQSTGQRQAGLRFIMSGGGEHVLNGECWVKWWATREWQRYIEHNRADSKNLPKITSFTLFLFSLTLSLITRL